MNLCLSPTLNDFSYGIGTSNNTAANIAVGDLNGDGKLDIATANEVPNTVSILINTGNGTYASAINYGAGSYPNTIALGDVNGDSFLDIATSNATSDSISILINNGNGTFTTSVSYCAGTGTVSNAVMVIMGDFNGDTKLDLAVALQSILKFSILINNGNGTFAPPIFYSIGSFGTSSIAASDLNMDGFLDLVTTEVDSINVLLNFGNGTFLPYKSYVIGATSTSQIAVGDINGDGKPDLAVSSIWATTYDLNVFINQGSGTFAPVVQYQTTGVNGQTVIADFNNDGMNDVATTNVFGTAGYPTYYRVMVFRNKGSGVLDNYNPSSYAVNYTPFALATGDLNNDGKTDMAVASNFNSNKVTTLLNNGCGFNSDYTTNGGAVYVSEIGDLNNDGKLDVTVANHFGASVYLNTGNGLFSPVVNYTVPMSAGSFGVQDVALNDINGDGYLDIAVSNYSASQLSLLINNGNGTFSTPVNYTVSGYAQNVVLKDLNGDDKTDIVVGERGASGQFDVFINAGGGVFAAPTTYTCNYYVADVSVGDLNGDNKPDLAIPNSNSLTVAIYINSGTGTFLTPVNYPIASSTSSAFQASSIAIGDLNGDNKPDLAMPCDNSDSVAVLYNNGNGTFALPVSFNMSDTSIIPTGGIVKIADINGDGSNDLVIGSYPLVFLFNNGSGVFSNPVFGPSETDAWGLSIGDLNGDGSKDFIVSNGHNNNIQILFNRSAVISPSNSPLNYTSFCGTSGVLYTSSGGNSYNWNPGGSTTDSLAVTTSGIYSVTVTSENGSCISTNTAQVVFTNCTSIQQFINNNEQINIYPNPNNGSFFIEPSSTTKQVMQVYDVNGKPVLSQTINGKTTIDASALNEGVYNISLQSNDGVINKRLVIVR